MSSLTYHLILWITSNIIGDNEYLTRQFRGFEDQGDNDESNNKKAAGEALVF